MTVTHNSMETSDLRESMCFLSLIRGPTIILQSFKFKFFKYKIMILLILVLTQMSVSFLVNLITNEE